jgi:DNA methylase
MSLASISSLFDDPVSVPAPISNKVVRSVSSSQTEILNWIIQLHCPNGFECDVTYSTGLFYKEIPEPKIKLDLMPQVPGVIAADVRAIPLRSGSLSTIMFDPPFLGGHTKNGKAGIMKERFSTYPNIDELWKMYSQALHELYRVLDTNGILVFKCQDTVENHKNYFTHCEVMSQALAVGFYPKDLFILTANNRPIQSNLKTQIHARKYHSYFWVFEKTKSKIKYHT